MCAGIEGDWRDALKQALARQTEVRKELDGLERELERLTTGDDESVVAARGISLVANRSWSRPRPQPGLPRRV